MLKKVLFAISFIHAVVCWSDNNPVRVEYWVDDDFGSICSKEVSGGVAQFTIDASSLQEGLHVLRYRAVASNNLYGPLQTWTFYRIKPVKHGSAHLEYWIDEGEHHSNSINNGNAIFTIDASAQTTGLHTLHYQVITDGDVRSPEQTWQFYKIEQREKRIKWYRIWWNNHQDKAVTVKVDDAGSGYLYEQTLAVPDYARNDGYSRNNMARFHIQFGDDRNCVSCEETAEVTYLDIYPPVTTLKASLSETGECVNLSWTTNEDNVRDYNVYYSENGEPFVLWIPNMTQQEAVFRGQKGSSYKFIVTSHDSSGNYEAIDENKAVKVDFK